ncbi:uncharacterized protein LOC143904530 [Temnothorax americanus]|uniref:uncharacterized protein LOC143904530 n=1 Tax=Temnothorax americanus TaxID=1964332 RepID=UPI0040691774
MVSCCAAYCTNSSKKFMCIKSKQRFQMCRFPTNPKRREIWIKNLNRCDYQPTLNSYLCEVHFTKEMWEKTRNGRKRLKSTAIPTIFKSSEQDFYVIQQPIPNYEFVDVAEVHEEHLQNERILQLEEGKEQIENEERIQLEEGEEQIKNEERIQLEEGEEQIENEEKIQFKERGELVREEETLDKEKEVASICNTDTVCNCSQVRKLERKLAKMKQSLILGYFVLSRWS